MVALAPLFSWVLLYTWLTCSFLLRPGSQVAALTATHQLPSEWANGWIQWHCNSSGSLPSITIVHRALNRCSHDALQEVASLPSLLLFLMPVFNSGHQKQIQFWKSTAGCTLGFVQNYKVGNKAVGMIMQTGCMLSVHWYAMCLLYFVVAHSVHWHYDDGSKAQAFVLPTVR